MTQIDNLFTSIESLADVAYDIAQGVLDSAFVVADKAIDEVKRFVDDVQTELVEREKAANPLQTVTLDPAVQDALDWAKGWITAQQSVNAAEQAAAAVDSEEPTLDTMLDTIKTRAIEYWGHPNGWNEFYPVDSGEKRWVENVYAATKAGTWPQESVY